MIKAAVATASLAALAFTATAAEAATANATARAKILRQVTLTNTSDLEFGTIVTGAAASTVDVSTSGARTCGAGLVCSGTTTAANFNIGGTATQTVNVVVPASVSLSNGSATMNVALTSTATSVVMNSSNAGSIQVGGTLSVAANQADGDYSGTFTLTADYQ